MEKIKQTKSIGMWGNKEEVKIVTIEFDRVVTHVQIPMKSVFQVKRGLESYIQKFYRHKTK